MKQKTLSLLLCVVAIFGLSGCDQTQKQRNMASNVLYDLCLQGGGTRNFCRCVRADLLQGSDFTPQMAQDILNNRRPARLEIIVLGARMRCQCRLYPEQTEYQLQQARRMAEYIQGPEWARETAGQVVTCKGVKQINY